MENKDAAMDEQPKTGMAEASGNQPVEQTGSRHAQMEMTPEQFNYSTDAEAAWAEILQRRARKRRPGESMADGSHAEAEPQKVSVPVPDRRQKRQADVPPDDPRTTNADQADRILDSRQ